MTANLARRQAQLRVILSFISSSELCMEALGMDLVQPSPHKHAWWAIVKSEGEDPAEKWD